MNRPLTPENPALRVIKKMSIDAEPPTQSQDVLTCINTGPGHRF